MVSQAVIASILAGVLTVLIWYLWQKRKNKKKLVTVLSKNKLLEKRLEKFQLHNGDDLGNGQDTNCKNIDASHHDDDNNKKEQKKGEKITHKGKSHNDKKVYLIHIVFTSKSLKQDPPSTSPLETLDKLLSWMPGFDEFSVSRISLKEFTRDVKKAKTMVCHDMKGGYVEDRFVQGFGSMDVYQFQHWHLIDSFCYFSHKFVTIPPPGWTNAAHTNGVKMFGTIITEWEDGAKLCMKMLEHTNTIERAVNALVSIAEYYGFDGWLVNIENEIAPAQVDNLLLFLKLLTDRMHEKISWSEVVWYDSVIYTGQLKWQNKLCVDNRIFFDACDGIFLNYNWTISHLQHSLYISGEERRHDVYAGVDVFGRGTFGGGGWNTYKALQAMRDYNLSAAIFAPGWVMEKFGAEVFDEKNTKFWELLTKYLYPHFVSSLPLATSFCRGYGKSVYIDGKKVKDTPWSNLSTHSPQPTFSNSFYQLGPKNAMEIHKYTYSTDDSYNGGGCIFVSGKVNATKDPSRTFFRLFKTEIPLVKSEKLHVSYTFKNSTDRLQIHLLLLCADSPNYLVFGPARKDGNGQYFIPAGHEKSYHFVQPAKTDEAEANNWVTRKYEFTAPISTVLNEVRLALTLTHDANEKDIFRNDSKDFEISLGEIKICEYNDFIKPIARPIHPRCREVCMNDISDENKIVVSFILSWDVVMDGSVAVPECFDVFVHDTCDNAYIHKKVTDPSVSHNNGSFIGRSFVRSYYVEKLTIPKECSDSIYLNVQSVDSTGRRNDDTDCSVLFKW